MAIVVNAGANPGGRDLDRDDDCNLVECPANLTAEMIRDQVIFTKGGS